MALSLEYFIGYQINRFVYLDLSMIMIFQRRKAMKIIVWMSAAAWPSVHHAHGRLDFSTNTLGYTSDFSTNCEHITLSFHRSNLVVLLQLITVLVWWKSDQDWQNKAFFHILDFFLADVRMWTARDHRNKTHPCLGVDCRKNYASYKPQS